MTKRKAITLAMKIDTLLWRSTILCGVCRNILVPGDNVEFDHIHALVHGGEHNWGNLRPLHAECHKRKSARDVAAKAKGDRLLGLTCNKPKKKIPSRPFPKRA